MLVRQLHVGDCGMCVVGEMAKDVGTAIHKSIVVAFLPCLASYFYEIPSLHVSSFLKCFLAGRKFLCREC